MSEDKNIINKNIGKTKSKLWSILSTIIKSIIVLLIIGFIMAWISAGGAEIYTKDAYNRNYTGGLGYHEYLNPFYGLIGIIIYILINFLGFLSYNYIANRFKNYKTIISKIMFILFSAFINLIMLIMYFRLFGGYSFENRLLELFNNIIICYGYITFPAIFLIVYIYRRKLKNKNESDMLKEELVDVYDEKKIKTEKIINRNDKDKLNDNEFVLAVHCWIINSKNEILITQRSLNLNRGGMWEDTHGGVKSGETSSEAMKRELKEELGLDIEENELILFKTLKRKNVFRDCYIILKDILLDSINFNDDEVMNCKYVSIEEFKEIINKGESTFTDFSQTIFNNVDINDLRKEIKYEC